MKYLLLLILVCAFGCKASDPAELAADSIAPHMVNFCGGELREGAPQQFELHFTTCGLGSNFCSMQPTFEVNGHSYLYTMQQNSGWRGMEWAKPQFVAEGKLRTSSIDSIINLIRVLPDTVWKWDPGISSGVIQYMTVRAGDKEVSFDLHNAYDVTAARIVNILNSNLPKDVRPLYIMMSSGCMESMSRQHVNYR